MKRISGRILLASLSLFLPLSASVSFAGNAVNPRVIYGEDNRVDVYAEKDANLRGIAQSTVAMISNDRLTEKGVNNEIKIKADVYGIAYGLCQEERFFTQPNAANCSGSLIAEDLIITAGHCISSWDCADKSFVFNYHMNDENTSPTSVPAEEIYKCQKVVGREMTSGQDYAIIQLERPVRGHRPLTLSLAPAQADDEIYVIGHPAGLPTKIAGGAKVRHSLPTHFVTNLDTYGGNSGSAVFSAKTNQIVGILVRGEQDFIFDRGAGCTRSNICAADKCHGEDVTHISYVLEALRKSRP